MGHRRLMEANEANALSGLKAHTNALFLPVIAKRQGRVVKTTGDALLPEFGGVFDAVWRAVVVQRRNAARRGRAGLWVPGCRPPSP